MKYIILVITLFTSVITTTLQAETIGVGAVLGAPTGLSLNLFTSKDQSIHSVAAWDLDDDEEEFLLFSHYTWRRHDFTEKNLGWFYGIGGRIEFLDEGNKSKNPDGDEFEIGPSATIGLMYEFNPMEVFLKANGTINVIEETDFETDAMLGLHYNF